MKKPVKIILIVVSAVLVCVLAVAGLGLYVFGDKLNATSSVKKSLISFITWSMRAITDFRTF